MIHSSNGGSGLFDFSDCFDTSHCDINSLVDHWFQSFFLGMFSVTSMICNVFNFLDIEYLFSDNECIESNMYCHHLQHTITCGYLLLFWLWILIYSGWYLFPKNVNSSNISV